VIERCRPPRRDVGSLFTTLWSLARQSVATLLLSDIRFFDFLYERASQHLSLKKYRRFDKLTNDCGVRKHQELQPVFRVRISILLVYVFISFLWRMHYPGELSFRNGIKKKKIELFHYYRFICCYACNRSLCCYLFGLLSTRGCCRNIQVENHTWNNRNVGKYRTRRLNVHVCFRAKRVC